LGFQFLPGLFLCGSGGGFAVRHIKAGHSQTDPGDYENGEGAFHKQQPFKFTAMVPSMAHLENFILLSRYLI
jgi:hypothetical protein